MVKDQRSAFKEGYLKNKELIDSINNIHNDTDDMNSNEDKNHNGIVNVYEDANTLSMFDHLNYMKMIFIIIKLTKKKKIIIVMMMLMVMRMMTK